MFFSGHLVDPTSSLWKIPLVFYQSFPYRLEKLSLTPKTGFLTLIDRRGGILVVLCIYPAYRATITRFSNYRVFFNDGEKVNAYYAYILMTRIDKFNFVIKYIVKHFIKYLFFLISSPYFNYFD